MSRLHLAWLTAVTLGLLTTSPLKATDKVQFDVIAGHPLLTADTAQTTWIKVQLSGCPKVVSQTAPANVAIVIDKSGSMTGEKIQKAKEAAIRALALLKNDDIVSVVAYDSTVNVLVPATKVSDRDTVISGINRIEAGGSTALFAGVSKGAAEVRKFLDKKRVNRVILLSDGLANVGPSSPKELAELGRSLCKEGISVTTLGLGLGYNEDLMTQLAAASDGDHAFIETPDDLVRIFRLEFDAILSVVAQEARVKVRCGPGVRVLRTLGPDATVLDNEVSTDFNILYSGHEEYLLVELDVPKSAVNSQITLATAELSFVELANGKRANVSQSVTAQFSESAAKVEESANLSVLVDVAEQVAVLRNARATVLNDTGRTEEARALLLDNARELKEAATRLKSGLLNQRNLENIDDAKNLDPAKYLFQRKLMRDRQLDQRSRPKL